MSPAFDPLAFHERAVQTPSHESVDEMRSLLVEALDDAGVDPRVDEAGNVVASRDGGSGTGDGAHIVLNTHVDTVPPHVSFERDGDVVRGRGSCDAKGPLAALVAAFLACEPTAGRVTLGVTPDEETTQTGATHLRESLSADGYVVGEPTGLDVCTGARGQFGGTITVRGTSAHAATPEEGANAIRAAAPVLQAMETYDEREAPRTPGGAGGDGTAPRSSGPGEHEMLGRPTLTATGIEGGDAPNQVPAECTITFDRRSVPPESAAEFRAGLEEHLYQWMPAGMDLRVDLFDLEAEFLEAFATDPDDPLVRTLADASGGEVRAFGAATEASFFAGDAPTVVFGPGVLADDEGAVAHSDREYVRRSDIERAAKALRETLDALV